MMKLGKIDDVWHWEWDWISAPLNRQKMPYLKAMSQLVDGAEKNFGPVYIVMPNINEDTQRVLIRYSYVNLMQKV